jgi:modification methylase
MATNNKHKCLTDIRSLNLLDPKTTGEKKNGKTYHNSEGSRLLTYPTTKADAFIPAAQKPSQSNNIIAANNLYNMPCEEGIGLIKEAGIKVDCLITSPPYNADIPYADYKDNKPYSEYINWLKEIFKSCQDIMTVGGTLAINVGDGNNGATPIHSDIIQFMTRELDYVMRSTIIWNKNTTTSRTSWGSFKSPSCPSFPTPFEYIVLFRYKDRYHRGKKEDITVTREEFVENSLAIWNIGTEKASKLKHPAPFPLKLPQRIIQQMTYRNDLVLDIFSGTGTTAIAAQMLDRRFIGFELSPEYHKIAIDRLGRYSEAA